MRRLAVQFTVRGVPSEVAQALRDRATRQNVSVNQLIIDELTKATIGRKKVSDFSDLVGRWQPDPVFDEIIEAQRIVNLDDWN